MMKDWVRRVKHLGWDLRPAPSPEDLAALEERTGPLPPPLASLYRAHDGASAAGPWRLMPIAEVLDFHREAVEPLGWARTGLRVFWDDGQSNYAGVFVTGPLAGYVAHVDHEGVDMSPVFASVELFLEAVLEAAVSGASWYEIASDPAPSTAGLDDPRPSLRAERAAAGDQDRVRLALAIMALTPHDETSSIMPFLDDPDMFVQARGCELLGRRRHEPAVDALARVARYGLGNGRAAATLALGAIGTPACHQALRQLVGEPGTESWAIERALAACERGPSRPRSTPG